MKNYFFNQRTVTFLISLLIASGLWLLIKLSGDFQTEHKVPLGFQSLPIDKVLINRPDSLLYIKTDNNGFDVLGQFLFSRNKSITIDFNKARYLQTTNGIQSYYILCSNLDQEIEDRFKTAEQILNVSPDSLIFKFEKLASKKLKINPQINLSFSPRFKQYQEMQIIPDSIVFFGASSLLASLTEIKTENFSIKNVNSNIDTVINLLLPNSQVIGQQEFINLKLVVEEYTEGKIKLPIQLEARASAHYKIFPVEAQITYQVALKDYAQVNPKAFKLQSTPDPNEPGKLILSVSSHPQNVIISNIHPASAEYIILK